MPRTLSAALVFGAQIWNDKGEKIGRIKDLMVDLNSGYAIAFFVFNKNRRDEDFYYPIPVKEIKEEGGEERTKFIIHEEKLENAPGFKEKERPKEFSKDFIETLNKHYEYNASNKKDRNYGKKQS